MFNVLDFREIFTAGMVLFAVIDIVGSIPIIIDLRKKRVIFRVKKPRSWRGSS